MGVREFKEKIVADKDFAAKFENIETTEELVKKASEEGFDFTVDDVEKNTELIDQELDAVAGGRSIIGKHFFVTPSTIAGKTYFVKD